MWRVGKHSSVANAESFHVVNPGISLALMDHGNTTLPVSVNEALPGAQDTRRGLWSCVYH